MSHITSIFNFLWDNAIYIWSAVIEQLNREYNVAPKLIQPAPAEPIYISTIEEYDGSLREAILESCNQVVPVFALDTSFRSVYVDDDDELDLTHEHIAEILKIAEVEDDIILPSDFHLFWSAAILTIALLAFAGYYTHQSYGLTLSPDLWDDFMVTIEETVEETGEVDERNLSDYIDDVILKGINNENNESDTIAERSDEEDERFINRSKIMLSSPLEEDLGSPKSFSVEGDETSPLNLSVLSDEIESFLSIEELKLNDDSNSQNLDPLSIDYTNELEEVAIENERERAPTQNQRSPIMDEKIKKSKFDNMPFDISPASFSVPETVGSVIQDMTTQDAETEEIYYVSASSSELKEVTDTDVIDVTKSSLGCRKLATTDFNSTTPRNHDTKLKNRRAFTSLQSNDFSEDVTESHLISELCSQSCNGIEADIKDENATRYGFLTAELLPCDDENTPVEEVSQSHIFSQLRVGKMSKEDGFPFLSHTGSTPPRSFEALPVPSDDRAPANNLLFDEPANIKAHVLKDQTNNLRANVSPSKIPLFSPTKPRSHTLMRGSPTPKPRLLPQISDPVLKYFFESEDSNGEDFLCCVFGDDPHIKFNIDVLSSLTKEEIEDIINIYIGKETSQNWSERYAKLDMLIGNTRLHLPERNYVYFQEKIGERLDDIFLMIRTTRSKLLGKVIILARDLVFFGSEIVMSSETYVNLIHALLSLTRESQSSKYIQKLTTKSLCVMSQALTPSSFINYFEPMFEHILKNRKMKGEKYASLFMIKFSILMNRDKFTREQLATTVKKLIPLIPTLSIDPYQKTRSEIIELYLILNRLNVPYEELNAFYQGLTTFLKSQVGPPAIPTDN